MADDTIMMDSNLPQEVSIYDRLAGFDKLPQDAWLASTAGVAICRYLCYFGRHQNGQLTGLVPLVGRRQWEVPKHARFSGCAWALIISPKRRATICACQSPVVSATSALQAHSAAGVEGIHSLSARLWQVPDCSSSHISIFCTQTFILPHGHGAAALGQAPI